MCSLALSLASVRWTLDNLPRQNRSPPDGSTYPSTVTDGRLEGTLNISPTWRGGGGKEGREGVYIFTDVNFYIHVNDEHRRQQTKQHNTTQHINTRDISKKNELPQVGCTCTCTVHVQYMYNVPVCPFQSKQLYTKSRELELDR